MNAGHKLPIKEELMENNSGVNHSDRCQSNRPIYSSATGYPIQSEHSSVSEPTNNSVAYSPVLSGYASIYQGNYFPYSQQPRNHYYHQPSPFNFQPTSENVNITNSSNHQQNTSPSTCFLGPHLPRYGPQYHLDHQPIGILPDPSVNNQTSPSCENHLQPQSYSNSSINSEFHNYNTNATRVCHVNVIPHYNEQSYMYSSGVQNINSNLCDQTIPDKTEPEINCHSPPNSNIEEYSEGSCHDRSHEFTNQENTCTKPKEPSTKKTTKRQNSNKPKKPNNYIIVTNKISRIRQINDDEFVALKYEILVARALLNQRGYRHIQIGDFENLTSQSLCSPEMLTNPGKHFKVFKQETMKIQCSSPVGSSLNTSSIIKEPQPCSSTTPGHSNEKLESDYVDLGASELASQAESSWYSTDDSCSENLSEAIIRELDKICPYPLCGVQLKSVGHINRHIESHGASMGFDCSQCTASYNRKDNREGHEQKTHLKK